MNRPITIIGGGMTGLATAFLAARSGKKVRILEAQEEVGGLLRTFEVGGSPLEHFYHHFFTHDAEIHWLIKELGISEQLFYQETSMGIYRGGKIYPFNSPQDLLSFKPLSFWDKIRFGLTSLYLGKRADWHGYEHISTMEWMRKWAGKGVAQNIWAPLMKAKFGPYAEEVPLAWMIGRLGQRMGSRQGGREQLGYLKGSLQTLLDALKKALEKLEVEIITQSPVEHLEIENGQLISVKTPQNRYQGGDFLFTIPSPYLADISEEKAPDLTQKLRETEYFHAVCVILALDRPLSDIYWLNIADENLPFGGVIEHTNFIPSSEYQGKHLVYLSRYFAASESLAQKSPDEIENLMLDGLEEVYPKFERNRILKSWVFQTRTAATVCDLNFSDKVPSCQTSVKNLYIANMTHIYPDERSTNNSIRVAAEACKTMGIQIEKVPAFRSLSATIGF